MFRFIVILSVYVFVVAGNTTVTVIQNKSSNAIEFPPLQTEIPETVPSSSLVLEATATKNSLKSSTDTEKPTSKNVMQAITSTEKSSDDAREDPSTSTHNSTVLVINITTVEGNETTSTAATVSSTELNLIPPANVNSSIAFVNETRKNSQIIIR